MFSPPHTLEWTVQFLGAGETFDFDLQCPLRASQIILVKEQGFELPHVEDQKGKKMDDLVAQLSVSNWGSTYCSACIASNRERYMIHNPWHTDFIKGSGPFHLELCPPHQSSIRKINVQDQVLLSRSTSSLPPVLREAEE